MAKPGRDLEALVARLEAVLGGTDVEVTSPDSLTDKGTGEDREVDVSLRGRLGSSSQLVIMECRDRSRVQDVTWIEQVASKRDSVGADTAVAVSSSGFSKGAVKKAKDLRVQLRKVADVDRVDVFSWLGTTGLELLTNRFDVETVALVASEGTPQELVDSVLSAMPQPFRTNSDVFRMKPTGQPATVFDIWSDVEASEPRIRATYEVLSPGRENGRRLGSLTLQFINPEQRYQVANGAGVIDIQTVRMEGVRLWVDSEMIPFSRLREYSNDDGVLIQTAEVDFAGPKGEMTLSLQTSPEGTFGGISISSKDEEGHEGA
jgi:hypothetical protein